MPKLRHRNSRWEVIAFIIFNKLLVGKNKTVSRSEIMAADNITLAVALTEALGLKKDPKHPEATLQRTIQNLREKKLIDFLTPGEWRLTEEGFGMAKTIGREYDYDTLLKAVKKKNSG
jgi:hypothetical protein